eukprot:TRINITY_DN23238_c1_g1_i3.p1 TRINITY_DN23238_c1_g1~~TRINITY_DN23238_c1_g1_i3.p1  ORF type:complete len:305 (+),score=49.50 TRINITY_DN23238_c1_g1_i3:82-915(+)
MLISRGNWTVVRNALRTATMSAAVQDLQKLSSTWTGQATQEQLMQSDMCILVDENDTILNSASKRDCHVFSDAQPAGLLHRAFSLFLFNSDNKLMLQQRAASKITFPSVWTNTCCSHPLTGMDPPEVDQRFAVEAGDPQGVKHAAIRKIHHELGIRNLLQVSDIKFLTRLHYCAKDGESAWGEHEMDYVLFAKVGDGREIAHQMNPEEVDDVRFVGFAELREMMATEGLKWSPWFRIIVENFLEEWWENLDKVLETDKYVDGKIHKLNVRDQIDRSQ